MRTTSYRSRGRRQGAAFTLIELLVVVTIIVLVIGLSVTGVVLARRAARRAATIMTINNLATGLEAYRRDCGMYPADSGMSTDGSEELCEGLLGWEDYGQDGAGPASPVNPNESLFGFRMAPGGHGKVYGPYAATVGDQIGRAADGNWVFVDGWGSTIKYYLPQTPAPNTGGWTGPGGIYPNIPSSVDTGFLVLLGNTKGDNQIAANRGETEGRSFLLVAQALGSKYFTKDNVVNDAK